MPDFKEDKNSFMKKPKGFRMGGMDFGEGTGSALKKDTPNPTWMGTDEYRDPADIPAQEYLDRGLDPADYIPGYKANKSSMKTSALKNYKKGYYGVK